MVRRCPKTARTTQCGLHLQGIHDETLYLPFATSDMVTRIAMVSLDSLLNGLVK